MATMTAPAGSDGHGLLVSLQAAQQLPRLVHGGAIVATTTAARGVFRLQALQPASGGKQYSASALMAALRCRCHGKHVGLAVSTLAAGQEEAAGGGVWGDETDDDASPYSDDDDGIDSNSDDSSLGNEAAEGLPGEVVLQAWASQACKADDWGLYEFELEFGEIFFVVVLYFFSFFFLGGGGGRKKPHLPHFCWHALMAPASLQGTSQAHCVPGTCRFPAV